MKKRILDKIMKRNYNVELETLLENKNYSEEAKNLLQTILYKIDEYYEEYAKAKSDIETKEEYINYLFEIINKEVLEIETMKMQRDNQNKTFEIEKAKQKIKTYPIDKAILYAIFNIAKQEDIVKSKNNIKNMTITQMLNSGSNMNLVEPIRDFNGYSWVIERLEEQDMYTNIVYQNLRILIGNDLLKKLTKKEYQLIENYENIIEKLQSEYGKSETLNIEKKIMNISILIYLLTNKEEAKQIYLKKEKMENELEYMRDTTKYIHEVITKKTQNTNKIEKLHKILDDETSLENEYKRRNRVLENSQKIFSKRVLSKIIITEIQDLTKENKKLEKITTVENIVKETNKIKKEIEALEVLNDIEIADDKKIKAKIKEQILELQEVFLECLKVKIKTVKTKEEAAVLLKTFRYYLEIYITETDNISKHLEYNECLQEVKKLIIRKAIKLKAMNPITETESLNYIVIEKIFTTKVIDLDKLSLKIEYKNEELYILLYDENTLADKIYLGGLRQNQLEEIVQKKNRKIKILI